MFRQARRTVPQGDTDRRNFTFEDYVQMCRDGEAKFSISEASKLLGMSRQELYRGMVLASVSQEEFEDALEHILAKGLRSTTALADEINRRTGKARDHHIRCPHCKGILYTRRR